MRVVLGLCVALAIGFGTAMRASEQTADLHFTVYGAGRHICRQWTAERDNQSMYVSRMEWVLGFVEGAAWQGVHIKETDEEGIAARIDRYCTAHQLDSLEKATIAVVQELRVK